LVGYVKGIIPVFLRPCLKAAMTEFGKRVAVGMIDDLVEPPPARMPAKALTSAPPLVSVRHGFLAHV